MSKEMKQLQVGDVVFEYSRWHDPRRHVIGRITRTRAFAAGQVFLRGYAGDRVRPFPSDRCVYNIATQKREAEYEKQKLVEFIENVNWKNVPLSKLVKIKMEIESK